MSGNRSGGAVKAQKDAAAQNQKALEALRSHIANVLVPTETRGGKKLYGLITAVTAVDASSGKPIVLTRVLTEAPAGATTETIGTKGTKAPFTQELPVTSKEIDTLVEVLRDRQFMRTPGY